MTTQLQFTAEAAIDDIEPNPANIRHELGDLTGLAESIGEVGILEPVLVYVNPDIAGKKYMLIAGHRRLAAATLAGLETVPMVERPAPSHAELMLMMLSENNHRSDLDPIDEGLALVEIKAAAGHTTVKAIAAAVSRSVTWVSERLAIVGKLPESLWDRVRSGDLGIGDAVQIAQVKGATDAEKVKLASESAMNREWAIFRIRNAAEQKKAVAAARKAWPGRRIIEEAVYNVHDLGAGPFGHASYGDNPGNVNLPPEMGDAEDQVVQVNMSSVMVYHLHPERLTPADFHPYEGERDARTLVSIADVPATSVRLDDLPMKGGNIGNWQRTTAHRACPGDAVVELPWQLHGCQVCTTPEVHEFEAGPTWPELLVAANASGAAASTPEGPRRTWRDDMGEDLTHAVEDAVRELLVHAAPGLIAALFYADEMTSYGSPQILGLDDENMPAINVEMLIEGVGASLWNSVTEVRGTRRPEWTADYDRPTDAARAQFVLDLANRADAPVPDGLEAAFAAGPTDEQMADFLEDLNAALDFDGDAPIAATPEQWPEVEELVRVCVDAEWTIDNDGTTATFTAPDERSFTIEMGADDAND